MSNLTEIVSGNMSKFDGNKNDWVTPSEIPDPDVLPKVKGYNLLIRPVSINKEIKVGTKGLIHLPDSFTEDVRALSNVGQVKAMGPLCYRDPNVKPSDGSFYPHGRYLEPWCKVGDYVVWGKHQGAKVVVRGVAYVLLQDELVLFTLNDPSDMNPILNALKV